MLSGGQAGPHKMTRHRRWLRAEDILDMSIYNEVITVSNDDAFAKCASCRAP